MSNGISVFTIGHSTRSIEEFIEMLKNFNVKALIDVRSYPGSRKCPWFGKEALRSSIEGTGLTYEHILSIGGRRTKGDADNNHDGWMEDGFRYYAAYASSSPEFKDGLDSLLALSSEKSSAIMCAEAVWWRCHRRIITDYLINSGREVHHIMSKSKSTVASMTPFAKISGSVILYPKS